MFWHLFFFRFLLYREQNTEILIEPNFSLGMYVLYTLKKLWEEVVSGFLFYEFVKTWRVRH